MQEMNYQKPEKKPRKAPAPKTKPVVNETAEETREKERSLGVMKMTQPSPSRIGRSPNYVETVGLGTLRVLSAEGLAEENNA